MKQEHNLYTVGQVEMRSWFIKQNYLLTSKWLTEMVDGSMVDDEQKEKMAFSIELESLKQFSNNNTQKDDEYSYLINENKNLKIKIENIIIENDI